MAGPQGSECDRVGFDNDTEFRGRLSPGDKPVAGTTTVSFTECSKKKKKKRPRVQERGRNALYLSAYCYSRHYPRKFRIRVIIFRMRKLSFGDIKRMVEKYF